MLFIFMELPCFQLDDGSIWSEENSCKLGKVPVRKECFNALYQVSVTQKLTEEKQAELVEGLGKPSV